MIYHKNLNNPGTKKRIQPPQRTPRILLDEEIRLLLQEAITSCHRDYTLIFFTLSTGLRNAEVIGLNIENIMPYEGITNQLDLPAEIAKGKKPRTIPLNPEIRNDLVNYIQEEYDHNRIPHYTTPLFRSKWSNKRIGQKDFQQILEKHSVNALKRRITPHQLRHTFATKLLARSNIKIVQDILGHASLQSTQIYLHPSSSEKAEAVDKLSFL